MGVPCLIALDPSFTATGWVVVELAGEGRVLRAGLVRTKPPAATERLTAAQANAARGCKIRRAVTHALDELGSDLAFAVQEGSAGSKSAKSASALARAQQACVDAIDHALGAPPLLVTPQSVKKATVGRLNASKDDLEAAATERWGWPLKTAVDELERRAGLRRVKGKTPKVLENVFDAACVAASVWDRPEVAGLRRVGAARS